MVIELWWYRVCPRCKQGRLVIGRDHERGNYYLECDECGSGWLDPKRADDPSASFLAIDVGMQLPTAEQIDAAGWAPYRLHSYTREFPPHES